VSSRRAKQICDSINALSVLLGFFDYQHQVGPIMQFSDSQTNRTNYLHRSLLRRKVATAKNARHMFCDCGTEARGAMLIASEGKWEG
jgi:hypothetical protein